MPPQTDPNAPLPMSYQQYQQNSAFYPPPEAGRPEPPSVQSHEMPTIRSPEMDPNIIQPMAQIRRKGFDAQGGGSDW
jgi:hypothetical protein